MDLKSKIILIYGPTASGKSNFAIKLAKKISGQIINADSMQVYKEFKVLTARPLQKDYQNIKHHLYGFQNAKKNFSTGDWLKMAKEKILQCREINKTPILVGGTGLYFKALTDGLVNIPKIPINFRSRVRNLHKRIGQKKFFQKLLQVDPLIKDQINSLDVQRSLRAFEIKSFTKKSMISWFKNTKSDYSHNDFFKICIDFPRKDLIERINKRSENMIKLGAILEVKRFIKLRVPKNKSLSKAIGISEIKQYLQKKIQAEQLIEKISIKTRQYAKRQSTWARGHMKDWNKINPAGLEKLLKKI
jgi:tRNA dimethylallyltransferase